MFTLKTWRKWLPITGSRPVFRLSWFQVSNPSRCLQQIDSTGSPAKWTPRSCPIRIPPDRGLRYIDQNAHRNPQCPLEPMLRSIFTLKPDFNPHPIGLITDRNNLRKIVQCILGDRVEEFRIDIELVGDTLLFTRWEKYATENVREFRGFGHSFENEFTTYSDELKMSTGHHRIIQYDVGTLTILARFEVDGFLPDNAAGSPAEPTTSSEIDDLTTSLGSIHLSSTSKTVQAYPEFESSSLKILRGGFNVPQDSLVELKTRAQRRPIQTSDVIFQLWFGQLRHLIAAYHSRGTFIRTDYMDFERDGAFSRFEKDNKDALGKLINVVHQIKMNLAKEKRKKAVFLFVGGKMKLFERTGDWNALPADLLLKWN